MALISTYSIDYNITAYDKWIGTDYNTGYTKNFTPSGLAAYFNLSSSIGVGGQIAFKFYNSFTGQRPQESITSTVSLPGFSTITTLKVHKNSGGGNYCLDILNTFAGNDIIISNTANANKFGHYKLLSIVQDTVETDFYNINLQFIAGHGSLEDLNSYSISRYFGNINIPTNFVETVIGDLVDNTDPNNPVVNTPNLNQVITKGNVISIGTNTLTLDAFGFYLHTDGYVDVTIGGGYADGIFINNLSNGYQASYLSSGFNILTTTVAFNGYGDHFEFVNNGHTLSVSPPNLTADRYVIFQDKTGTVALLSDIPSIPAAQNLQSVTTVGAETTNPIKVKDPSNAAIYSTVSKDNVFIRDQYGWFTGLSLNNSSGNKGFFIVNNSGGRADIVMDSAIGTEQLIFKLPHRAGGTYAFAMIDDIPSLSGYATQSWVGSNYYPLTNPSGYITSSALSGYLLSSTAASTYYPLSNPSGYITSSALSLYITSSTVASTYYPLTNPSGYITTSALSNYIQYSSYGTNNISANNFFDGFTSVAASGTLITLTVNSTPSYLVTGSGGQTIKLPNATTLPNGTTFEFNNNQSSGAILVNNNSNTLVKSVPSGGYLNVVLIDNSTGAGSWDTHFQLPSNTSWSTNTFDYPGSITSATWNGVSIADNRIASASTWNAKVPSTRTINTKALSSDIVLTPSDIGSPSGSGTSTGTNTGDQDLSSYEKFFVRDATTGSTVTGTVSQTILISKLVPGGTLANGSVINLYNLLYRSTRVLTGTYTFYINTTNNLSGSPVQIGAFSVLATIGFVPFERTYRINSGNLEGFSFSTSSITDKIVATIISTTTYTVANDYYWIAAYTPASSTDTAVSNMIYIKGIK